MSPLSKRPIAVLAALALVAGGAACELRPPSLNIEGQAITADAQETEVTVEIAAAVSALPALTLEKGHSTLAAVVASQKAATKFFQPASCLDVTVEANVVTYAFDHCKGPWGAVDLTGAEVVTFSPGDGPGSTVFEMRSEGLTANGVAVEHEATVFVALEEGGRRIVWQGGFSGTTAKGKAFASDSDLDLFLGDDGCARLSGTSASQLGLRGLTLDYQNVERCGPPGTCPSGVIEATGKLSGATVTLVFDGTQTLLAQGENGGELEVTMKCAPPAVGGSP